MQTLTEGLFSSIQRTFSWKNEEKQQEVVGGVNEVHGLVLWCLVVVLTCDEWHGKKHSRTIHMLNYDSTLCRVRVRVRVGVILLFLFVDYASTPLRISALPASFVCAF